MLQYSIRCDGIMSEHLLYSHPIISVLLSRLFRAMLAHGYVPCAFGNGIVIPLLKDANLDKTNMDNYRAITLSPVISKLFELYLMDILHDFLYTSELQFGFKANHGCRDAFSVLYNTVEYYASNGSTVNIVCLDLSKAFDKVNLYGLAIKLMNRNVPKSFVSVIIDWYNKICVKVRWNETYLPHVHLEVESGRVVFYLPPYSTFMLMISLHNYRLLKLVASSPTGMLEL